MLARILLDVLAPETGVAPKGSERKLQCGCDGYVV